MSENINSTDKILKNNLIRICFKIKIIFEIDKKRSANCKNMLR